MEFKSTLNLPKTSFPMKANLPQNEPGRLAKWKQMNLYQRIRASREGRPVYRLHDGPPYANGPIHLGHALNKSLKDFVVKSRTMAGFDAPYVPGWDCHGLPIEIKVDDALGRKKLEMQPIEVRNACRAYAEKYLDLQRDQFIRMGVFGRFEDPYSTMSKHYEATIARMFFDFLERDFIYKGLKPVYWCIHDRTALAEAEVEYESHTSPSIYVKYPLTSDPGQIDASLSGKKVNTIIWTTTPWTLPASMAVAFHPEFEYVALQSAGEVFIVAEALAASVRQNCGLPDAQEIARFKGSRMERATFAHPFLERSILGVLADYVTADQGTGAVHTAPSHGADDFYTGVKYGLDQSCNVDAGGRLRNGLPEYEGKTVFEANPFIIELLKARGVLMGSGKLEHSYPHCWRCHRPVIFRATEQWFISMETPMQGAGGKQSTFRQLALEEIKRVKWDPAWGEERISNMIATRPDWCISRQRIWGVPIPVFFCACGQLLRSPEANQAVVDLFAREGADAWYTREANAILPAGTRCSQCGITEFRKEMDIIDVWFESGSSWRAVLGEQQADLYLEGGDQYRGWFHSSLLCSVGTRGRAPYRGVATNGWTLDPQGRAFSKSLGNGVDPVDVANRYGAEIVRLWVASVDFREDVHASEELMKQVAENYRKIRNTFRYVLGNLHDFDPAVDQVPFDEMESLDQYMLLETAELLHEVRRWYEEFAFHRIYHRVNEFCANDLSAVYFDVLKDRLYTFAPKARGRRSAQTAIWRIGEALVRLLAPVMSFTADEVWEYLPKVDGRAESVHMAFFPEIAELMGTAASGSEYQGLADEWKKLFEVRDVALKALEEARKEKTIGSALEAGVTLTVPPTLVEMLQRHQRTLRALLIVSQVEIVPGEEASGIIAEVSPAAGQKCERCWNYSTLVGQDDRYPTLCERCVPAVDEILGGGKHA